PIQRVAVQSDQYPAGGDPATFCDPDRFGTLGAADNAYFQTSDYPDPEYFLSCLFLRAYHFRKSIRNSTRLRQTGIGIIKTNITRTDIRQRRKDRTAVDSSGLTIDNRDQGKPAVVMPDTQRRL